MFTLILIGSAAILFLVGVILIVRGASGEPIKVEAIADPKEIHEAINSFSQPAAVDRVFKIGDLTLRSPVNIAQDPGALKDPFEADKDLLKRQIDELKADKEKHEQDWNEVERDYKKSLSEKDERIQALEQDIAQLREATLAPSQSAETVDALKSQMDILRSQFDEAQARQENMKEAYNRLREEKDRLSAQVQKWEVHATDLQANLASAKVDGDKIKSLEGTIEELRAQKQKISVAEFEGLNDKLTGSLGVIESLKRENKELLTQIETLENTFKDTGELNTQLVEKERLMQYELIKNRAQILGLERICDDFKRQIELINAGQVAHSA